MFRVQALACALRYGNLKVELSTTRVVRASDYKYALPCRARTIGLPEREPKGEKDHDETSQTHACLIFWRVGNPFARRECSRADQPRTQHEESARGGESISK